MNNYFQVKVKFTKQLENGTFKRVTEPYLLSAMTHSDAETRIYKELGTVIRGEFNVVGISPFPVVDIFTDEDSDKWYTVFVSMQDPSLDTEKIKMIKAKYLVGADNIQEAFDGIQKDLAGVMSDFTITGISESSIVDIFPYKEDLDREISRTPVAEESEEEVDEIESIIEESGN
jgi:hypothetical protein